MYFRAQTVSRLPGAERYKLYELQANDPVHLVPFGIFWASRLGVIIAIKFQAILAKGSQKQQLKKTAPARVTSFKQR